MIIRITVRLIDYLSNVTLMPRVSRVLARCLSAPHAQRGLTEVRRLQRQLATGDGAKYLHSSVWLLDNALRLVWLSLDRRPPCRILDLGSGAGYFIAMARALGHDAQGVDLGEHAIYTPVNQAFGNPITWHYITAECPYSAPASALPFDVITAFSITFDQHGRRWESPTWEPGDWRLFLSNLNLLLRPGGTVLLQLNTLTFRGCRGDEFPVFRSRVPGEAGFECLSVGRKLVELKKGLDQKISKNSRCDIPPERLATTM